MSTTALLPVPTKAELATVIPSECFEISLRTSLLYAASSVALTAGTGLAAWLFLPLTWAWAPVWVLYALVCGTFACGVWVIAHECGHGAFSKSNRVQNTVGFVFHSALLVPYFSWQRSHAIHHAKTNHLVDGETHVPRTVDSSGGQRLLAAQSRMGSKVHPALIIASRLLFGWPLYLLLGMTGGPNRGTTNHFWPYAPFSKSLFPARMAKNVLMSAGGVLVTLGLLVWWAVESGPVTVLALYGGPYLVCNAWLVGYTWLQHTDDHTPHYTEPEWSFIRGAFCSIDRPYGTVVDFLHHRIGSTHVAHHLFSKIPHYNAKAATDAIAEAYPELYRYDPTPVPAALWRAGKCLAVEQSDDGWRYATMSDA